MLILTRKISNFTCTIGEMRADDDDSLMIYTQEGRMPKDGCSYIKFLLPPGDYILSADLTNVHINGEDFRGFFPIFKRVPWFPMAGFYSSRLVSNEQSQVSNDTSSLHNDHYTQACKGRIFIGTSSDDEFSVSGSDDATIALLRYCKDKSETEFMLRIIEDRSQIELHEYSREDLERQKQQELEDARREALRKIVYNE